MPASLGGYLLLIFLSIGCLILVSHVFSWWEQRQLKLKTPTISDQNKIRVEITYRLCLDRENYVWGFSDDSFPYCYFAVQFPVPLLGSYPEGLPDQGDMMIFVATAANFDSQLRQKYHLNSNIKLYFLDSKQVEFIYYA